MPRPAVAITGASSGIGAAFARRLAHDGWDLILIARRRDRLERIAADLSRAHKVDVSVVEADLTLEEGLTAAEAAISAAPRLELLINNAGFGVGGRFFSTPVEEHERMHRLHVLATVRLSHAALRRMVPANAGAVINVSSVAGFTASPGSVSYSATKHWMNNFTEGLWLDLRTRGSAVRVQALCPGFTHSEFHDVMPMDRGSIPKAWWTPPEEVVSASLAGLKSDRLFVIPGWRYRLTVALTRVAPRSMVRSASVWFARRFRKQRN